MSGRGRESRVHRELSAEVNSSIDACLSPAFVGAFYSIRTHSRASVKQRDARAGREQRRRHRGLAPDTRRRTAGLSSGAGSPEERIVTGSSEATGCHNGHSTAQTVAGDCDRSNTLAARVCILCPRIHWEHPRGEDVVPGPVSLLPGRFSGRRVLPGNRFITELRPKKRCGVAATRRPSGSRSSSRACICSRRQRYTPFCIRRPRVACTAIAGDGIVCMLTARVDLIARDGFGVPSVWEGEANIRVLDTLAWLVPCCLTRFAVVTNDAYSNDGSK